MTTFTDADLARLKQDAKAYDQPLVHSETLLALLDERDALLRVKEAAEQLNLYLSEMDQAERTPGEKGLSVDLNNALAPFREKKR